MRLDKFLANSGIGTRSIIRNIIKNKKVFVNGQIAKDNSMTINENEDIITIDNKRIEYKKYVYIMMNKPKNYISATYDRSQKTVIDLLKNNYYTYKLFPVGRLDIDTEGLLILTNDGLLSHNLLSPKKHIKKKYYIIHKNLISNDNINELENGINIGDHITKNDTIYEKIDDFSCFLTISEGKFHQIKRMFKAINNEVTYLKRIAMNKLYLDENLKIGEYREITKNELELLKDGI